MPLVIINLTLVNILNLKLYKCHEQENLCLVLIYLSIYVYIIVLNLFTNYICFQKIYIHIGEF